MLQTLRIELKRLFSNKLSLALVILAPVVILFLFVSVISPLIFSNKRFSEVQIALYNEDPSEDVQLVISDIKNNRNIRSLVTIIEVDSLSEGMDSLASNDTAIFAHVPPNTIDSLYQREKVVIDIWINPEYNLESGVIMPLIVGVSDGFNRIQNSIDIAYYKIYNELSPEIANQAIYDQTMMIGVRMLNRSELYELVGVSPLGRFLPIEYYVSAIFSLFIALGIVPLSGYNSADFTSGAIVRGISMSQYRYKYLFARIISGAIYILLCSFPMFITSLIIMGSDAFFGSSFPALFITLLLAAFTFSATSVFLALWFKSSESATWSGFYYILFSALIGGVILPDNYIPEFLVKVGHFLPIRAVLNGFSYSLFDFKWNNFGVAVLMMATWLALFVISSLFLFNRRVKS
jgi:ABC-type transport system involved in multi-copper enzyme maturation permease subunit